MSESFVGGFVAAILLVFIVGTFLIVLLVTAVVGFKFLRQMGL